MTRWFAPLALSCALLLGISPAPARAQAEAPPEEGKSEGRPWDGYFATLVLAGAALFVVGKSARR